MGDWGAIVAAGVVEGQGDLGGKLVQFMLEVDCNDI